MPTTDNFSIFIDTFMEEGISLDDLLISMETDGCNTIAGHKSGVQKKISDNEKRLQVLKDNMKQKEEQQKIMKEALSNIVCWWY